MEKLKKQDILVRLSIDPQWKIDDPNSPFTEMIKQNNYEEILNINVDSLNAEKRGRWKQILKMVAPIFKKTIEKLNEMNPTDEFIYNKFFQEYLSSDYLWDVNCSLEHPVGFGKGSEKGTSFYNYIVNNVDIPIYIKELSELEYCIFKASYIPSNKKVYDFSKPLYLAQNVSLIKSEYGVLNILENNNNINRNIEYYVVGSKGKVYRIDESTYRVLTLLKNEGNKTIDSSELQFFEQANNIGILTNDLNVIDKDLLNKFFGIK